ncbi:MFS transporter [Kutzneria buriramensis]|uniref:Putative MFS family arabinose efflux permease n=1 Tax=Kutzneria buriramensis TaxID=1045776 RepID=A0A3E0HL94_9PSEU|nr:MFS transporter [Kutzneria buriramensis]REH47120.1 putative MFS family arabinose efflux permease [Kutzneria buriramensis]
MTTVLLRHAAFMRLWLSGLFAETAEWMLQFALPVYIFRTTGSYTSLAVAIAVGTVPMVLASPAAGVIADRFDRRRVLFAVCLGQAAISVPLLFSGGSHALIYVVMAAQSALASLFEPTRNALVPALVGQDRLASANGLMGFNSNIARLAGLSLGGLVLGVWGFSSVIVCYLTALVLAAVLLVQSFGVHVERTHETPTGDWLDGVRAFRDPELRATGVTLALMSLGQGMFLTLFVLFVAGPLHGGDPEIGLLRGIQAVGGIGAGLLIAAVANRISAVRMMGLGILSLGVCSALIWNLPHVTIAYGVYVVLFALVGAPAVVAATGALTAVQLRVPDEQAGRVLATVFAGIAGLNAVGTLLAGYLVGVVGLEVLLDVQAGLLVAAGLAALFRR